ncbi:hypothetical protein B0T25DRAFT_550089 [Lasiosphaeria hispida]|uniref:Uncharacterized protein n=1 Tax=Lasiosphaeria hispida TaxID=260671 RepID=A0AAJ0HG68_9PEZI|nr:hypothetical protein B0T25DRAFT_550089 [Lasiosphaeria hispida]
MDLPKPAIFPSLPLQSSRLLVIVGIAIASLSGAPPFLVLVVSAQRPERTTPRPATLCTDPILGLGFAYSASLPNARILRL